MTATIVVQWSDDSTNLNSRVLERSIDGVVWDVVTALDTATLSGEVVDEFAIPTGVTTLHYRIKSELVLFEESTFKYSPIQSISLG